MELVEASKILNAGIIAPKVLRYDEYKIESTGTYIDWLRRTQPDVAVVGAGKSQ